MSVHPFRLLSFFCLAVILSGCALRTGLPPQKDSSLKDLTPADSEIAMKLSAQGVQSFRCVKDSQGLYWKFIAPRAELRNAKKILVVTQGTNHTFWATDGSRLNAKITRSTPAESSENLRNLLYETHPESRTGVLSRVNWVVRHSAQGGVPLTQCSSSQLGMILNVRFRAQYDFYRQKTSEKNTRR